jgi:hypothetical protein
MNAADIDWSGKLPLTAIGAIDQRAAESAGYHGARLRPMPVAEKSSDKYRELEDAVRAARRMAQPASAAEAGFELKRLSVWCPMQNRDVRDFKMMIHDALTDLADIPLDLIQKACGLHRNDPDPRCDFFPRPARLKTLIADEMRLRRLTLFRLERLLEIANTPPKLPPPITLAELTEQAQKQIELEAMMAGLFGRAPPPPLTPEQYATELTRRTEAKIHEAQRDQHLSPAMKLAKHQCAGENIQMPAHRRMVLAQGAPNLGKFCHLAVIMRDHHPEPPQRFR